MGPEGAINVIFRKEIESSVDKNAARQRLVKEYRDRFAGPNVAASVGIIDEIIDPAMTRAKVIAALASLRNKKEFRPSKKHGNVQL
jgi:acetyl-CoA carboxylase carboxyltransferase component